MTLLHGPHSSGKFVFEQWSHKTFSALHTAPPVSRQGVHKKLGGDTASRPQLTREGQFNIQLPDLFTAVYTED